MLLMWDAMGYNAGIRYDKHTKQLIGFAEDFEFGLCVQNFSNKVNVLSVISPQQEIKINFPVCHHHVNVLNSTQIYEQVMTVVEDLYNLSAVRIVGLICDGASEHTKFFRIVLHGPASESPTRSVYMGHPCDPSVKIFSISDVPHLIKKGRGSLFKSGENGWSTRRMLYGTAGDTIHDGSLLTWDPLVWLHEERNKRNESGQLRRKYYFCCSFYYILIYFHTLHTVLRLVRKLRDENLYPTSLELLRVYLAATVFSDEVQDLLDRYKDDVSRALNIRNLDPLSVYLSHFWELLQLNNSEKPITWSAEVGLDDVVKGTGKFNLKWISSQYGVNISHLETITGIERNMNIPDGVTVRFNRPQRWIEISKWFSNWENWIKSLPDMTRGQKSKMFITHQLHGDLQRTCHSMYDIIHEYVEGDINRRWVPKRFSQDPLESFFSEIRQSGGGNADGCREHIDSCVHNRRWRQMRKNNLI